MKVNLPIFKDEKSKDVVAYHSWQWDVAIFIDLVGMISISYLTSFTHCKDSLVTKQYLSQQQLAELLLKSLKILNCKN